MRLPIFLVFTAVSHVFIGSHIFAAGGSRSSVRSKIFGRFTRGASLPPCLDRLGNPIVPGMRIRLHLTGKVPSEHEVIARKDNALQLRGAGTVFLPCTLAGMDAEIISEADRVPSDEEAVDPGDFASGDPIPRSSGDHHPWVIEQRNRNAAAAAALAFAPPAVSKKKQTRLSKFMSQAKETVQTGTSRARNKIKPKLKKD